MFNWVHNKFHYNPLKDRNSSRKDIESNSKEGKRQGLAKQVDEIVDIVDDWRINGRRFTIFLMGFERSSKPRNYKAEYSNLKKEGKRYEFFDDVIVDNDEDDDHEFSPLMATTFQNNFDGNGGEFCTQFDKSKVVVAMERDVVAQRLGRRVTLADLFMVDADGNPKSATEKVAGQDLQKKLLDVETADCSRFADKPKVAVQPHARNLRRLMRKMMKRKIHGEVEQEQLLGEKSLNKDDKLYGNIIERTNSLLPI